MSQLFRLRSLEMPHRQSDETDSAPTELTPLGKTLGRMTATRVPRGCGCPDLFPDADRARRLARPRPSWRWPREASATAALAQLTEYHQPRKWTGSLHAGARPLISPLHGAEAPDSYRWAMARVPISSASAPYQRASSTIAPSRRWPFMATGASSKPPAMSAVARIP
jgi:hypothetical protein